MIVNQVFYSLIIDTEEKNGCYF